MSWRSQSKSSEIFWYAALSSSRRKKVCNWYVLAAYNRWNWSRDSSQKLRTSRIIKWHIVYATVTVSNCIIEVLITWRTILNSWSRSSVIVWTLQDVVYFLLKLENSTAVQCSHILTKSVVHLRLLRFFVRMLTSTRIVCSTGKHLLDWWQGWRDRRRRAGNWHCHVSGRWVVSHNWRCSPWCKSNLSALVDLIIVWCNFIVKVLVSRLANLFSSAELCGRKENGKVTVVLRG